MADQAGTEYVCIECGGAVVRVMVHFLGVSDEDAVNFKAMDEDWEKTSYVETGLCSLCGAKLTRTLGPREVPIAHMQPTSRWQIKNT